MLSGQHVGLCRPCSHSHEGALGRAVALTTDETQSWASWHGSSQPKPWSKPTCPAMRTAEQRHKGTPPACASLCHGLLLYPQSILSFHNNSLLFQCKCMAIQKKDPQNDFPASLVASYGHT